jgi:hypothetical protein
MIKPVMPETMTNRAQLLTTLYIQRLANVRQHLSVLETIPYLQLTPYEAAGNASTCNPRLLLAGGQF